MISLLLLSSVQALMSKKTISFSSSEPIVYLNEFRVDEEASYELQMKSVKSRPRQKELDTFEFTVTRGKLLSSYNCTYLREQSELVSDIEVPKSGKWSDLVGGKLLNSSNFQFWVSNCANNISDRRKFRIELKVLNRGEVHLPAELIGLKKVYYCSLCLFLLITAGTFKGIISNPIIAWVNASIFFQVISLILCISDLNIYERTGAGSTALAVLGYVLENLSQLALLFLLILISMGWTIRYTDFPDADVNVFYMTVTVIINCIFSGIHGVISRSLYETSFFEIALFFIRALFYIIFFSHIRWQMKTDSYLLKSFIYQLFITGSIYFIGVPLLYFGSEVIPLDYQINVIVSGSKLIHWVSCAWFCYIVKSKNSAYSKATVLSDGILPEGKLHNN